jgi:5-methylcytosine-specific restriction endonuclease McrA
MTEPAALPLPDSEELTKLKIKGVHRLIYNFLYVQRDPPPSMQEIRDHVFASTGKYDEQLDRRRRDLNRTFYIEPQRWPDGTFRYQLLGWADIINADAHSVSEKVRYQVLQSGRCAKCGKSPGVHKIVLVVDHVVPQKWGGGKELENLQPLCEQCNRGKKDYYAEFDRHSDEIRQAINFDEPHRRIAMLLKALDGHWISSELVGAVASAKQFQDDWHKRLRELRELGIDYEVRKTKQASGRVLSDWRLTNWVELPDEPLSPLIRKLERDRRAATTASD